jgi:CheY-like chemotaxis protein
LVVDDNKGDQTILKEAFKTLGILNEIIFASDGEEALTYMKSDEIQPVLILCDIDMPIMDGLQLREKIFKDIKLRKKCIPFIFMSSNDSEKYIEKAYEFSVQGYFTKAKNFDEAVELLSLIVKYWKLCKHPNNRFFLIKKLKKNIF